MQNLTVYKGDYLFSIPFTLLNNDGTAKDITGLVPRLKVWNGGGAGITLFTGSTTYDSATSGTCHYVVVSTDLSATGIFAAEIELNNTTSGLLQTWDQFTLSIKESP